MMRRLALPSIAAFVVVHLPALAWALGPEAAHGEEHAQGHGEHGPQEILWGGPRVDEFGRTPVWILLLNFAVLAFVLHRLLFRNMANTHREKVANLSEQLEKATLARTEAEQLIGTYKDKIDALDGEIETTLEAAKRSASNEREAILAEAREQAKAILESAEEAAEREALLHRQAIERDIARQALDKAEAALRSQFGGADQTRSIDHHVTEIGAAQLRGVV